MVADRRSPRADTGAHGRRAARMLLAKRCRLTLTRRDAGIPYLNRWGIETRLGGVYLHHITTPDPGLDYHNHPWWFASLILAGGYGEVVRDSDGWKCGRRRRRWSLRTVRLDQSHRIIDVWGDCWTLVVSGPKVQEWGYWTPDGYLDHADPRADARRGLDENYHRKAI